MTVINPTKRRKDRACDRTIERQIISLVESECPLQQDTELTARYGQLPSSCTCETKLRQAGRFPIVLISSGEKLLTLFAERCIWHHLEHYSRDGALSRVAIASLTRHLI